MTVESKTTLRFEPFEVPHYVRIHLDTDDDGDMGRLTIDMLDLGALDDLAATWLDNLYASVNQPSPFTLEKRRSA